jgi:peptide/nickel transport system permease protein
MTALAVTELTLPKPQTPRRLAVTRFLRRPAAVAGLIVIVIFVAAAILAPLIAPYDPIATSWSAIRKAPSAAHWMGTDENGRDVLSRVLFGARASLLAGVVAVVIAAGIGVPAGLLAGFTGGWLDALLSRIVDAMLAIGVSTAPRFMRVARAATLEVGSADYVQAAWSLGARSLRVAVRHIAPNIVPPLLVQASLSLAAAIIAEASLSFLGLGQQPPSPSWGSMLNTAQRFLTQAPWLAVFPGVAIFLCVLSFNLVGDGLRDALDPRGPR